MSFFKAEIYFYIHDNILHRALNIIAIQKMPSYQQ